MGQPVAHSGPLRSRTVTLAGAREQPHMRRVDGTALGVGVERLQPSASDRSRATLGSYAGTLQVGRQLPVDSFN